MRSEFEPAFNAQTVNLEPRKLAAPRGRPRKTAEQTESYRIVGANLKRRRESLQISQQKLADLAQLELRTVQRHETGECSQTDDLEKYLGPLNCNLDDLLEGAPPGLSARLTATTKKRHKIRQ